MTTHERRESLYELVELAPEGPAVHNALLRTFAASVMTGALAGNNMSLHAIHSETMEEVDKFVIAVFDVAESMMDEYYRRSR